MTGKEIWHSCLYTAVAACTGIFLWSVATSLKNIANTFNKWSPENVCDGISQAMKKKDGLSDAVADFATKVCGAINHAIKDEGGLSDTAKASIRKAIAELCDAFNDEFGKDGLFDTTDVFLENLFAKLAARGVVTVAEMINMMRDANMGVGVHFVGKRLSDERIEAARRNVTRPCQVEIESE